ncbi:MAG TPA: arylsulfotransferase family protein [Thermoleophilaceae bacterium]|nr:arylsulfotransferase family protein [Thermoleophilaceae bacterium]
MSARLQTWLIAAAAFATIVAVGCGSSAAGDDGIATFPMAGTPTASPKTTVSFRGDAPAKITGIVVKGSRSGRHGGTLKPHPDGNGVSFVSKKDFRPGETVTVDAKQKLVREKDGVVKFKIAEKAPVGVPTEIRADPAGHPDGEQRFKSSSLRPLTLKINKRTSKAAPGSIFVAPKAGAGQDGPIITDATGQVIWSKRVPKFNSAFDFRVQQYAGAPHLTWWQGQVFHGQGRGKGYIYDNAYRRAAVVEAGNGYKADFHEFQLSRDGKTAFLLIYEPVKYDLSSIGGSKNGSVLDGIVQEVDIKTGIVLFEWHTMGSVSVKETYAKIPKDAPLDVSHVNSVHEEKDGNLLVSARDMHAALELDRRNGKVLWKLGGKDSDYKLSNGAKFVSQHDIRRDNAGRVTVFDNGSPPSTGRTARGIALNVNEDDNKVTLKRAFRRKPEFESPSQGNVQPLPNGNYMIGWGGDVPFFTEFTPSGDVALDGNFVPETVDTYRTWHMPWTAQPSKGPDVVAEASGGETDIFVSWNGATEVARWRVKSGPTPDALLPGKTFVKKGFETKTTISGVPTYLAVEALDADGKVLDTSKPVQPQG